MTDGTPAFCSQCGGGSYTNIFQHWASPHTDCERPDPSEEEQSLIIGLWLSGIDIQTKENSKYPNIVKYSTNRDLLEWVADELGMWVKDSKVMEIRSADEQADGLQTGFGGTHDANTLYAVRVRPSAFIQSLQDAAPTEVAFTPTAARVLYGFRGRVETRAHEVMFNHPEPEDIVAVLTQHGFTATAHPIPEHSIYRVRVHAEDARAFAEYIRAEDALPGCAEKFQRLAALQS